MTFIRISFMVFLAAASCSRVEAQFVDDFDGSISDQWTWFTGDGLAEMDFSSRVGSATISVDASRDTSNIWWALIKRDVSSALDLSELGGPETEIRLEARVRVSHAPRRLNLHVNTKRTTDFHSHLMEYDIPDTLGWHVVSMTTRGFDAGPGDQVNVQMALMDWGSAEYAVEIDYFRADLVESLRVPPDLGSGVPYHPRILKPTAFTNHLTPVESEFVHDGQRVSTSEKTNLSWDLKEFKGSRALGPGLLEFVTASVPTNEPQKDGLLRIVESGNPQMIIDVMPGVEEDPRVWATISRPALQRLIDGETSGLEIHSLLGFEGMIGSPMLHFNLADERVFPGAHDEAKLVHGLLRAEDFRRFLLDRSSTGLQNNVSLLASVIARFSDSTRVRMPNSRLDVFTCGVDHISSSLENVDEHQVVSLFDSFKGEWYGTWDKHEVHHDWGEVIALDPPMEFAELDVAISAIQYAWLGDGFGWNVVAIPRDNPGRRVVLGTVFHVMEGDPSVIRLHRPHVAIPCGPNRLIWITDREVFFEEVILGNAEEDGEQYQITGFDYKWDKSGTPVPIAGFHAVYLRDPSGPHQFLRFPIDGGLDD